VDERYPLTPMQQGLLFEALHCRGEDIYFRQIVGRLVGQFEPSALKKAWQKALERHAILRSYFVLEGVGEPVQAVRSHVSLPWVLEDWTSLEREIRDQRFCMFLDHDRRQGVNFRQAPLFRLALLQMEPRVSGLVVSYHHVLLDGWSVSLLMKEVLSFYRAALRGEEPNHPPPPEYKEYLLWLRRQDRRQAETFWRESLRGLSSPTPLPLCAETTELKRDLRYGGEQINLSTTATERLVALTRAHHLTLNTIVQASWGLLLSRYTGCREVVFGTVVSGRPADLPGSDEMIGLFINALPVRIRFEARESYLECLQRVQREQIRSREYDFSSLVDVQSWSGMPRDRAMFETCVAFQNYPSNFADGRGSFEVTTGLRFEHQSVLEPTNYPLLLSSWPASTIPLRLVYRRDRYDRNVAVRLLDGLRYILEQVSDDCASKTGEISVIDVTEREQLLVGWNRTVSDYPDCCAHSWFESQAEATPTTPAVVVSDPKRESACCWNGLSRRLSGRWLCSKRGERTFRWTQAIQRTGSTGSLPTRESPCCLVVVRWESRPVL
jgi:Condensation domain